MADVSQQTLWIPIADIDVLPIALPTEGSETYTGAVDGTALVRCASSLDRVQDAVEMIDLAPPPQSCSEGGSCPHTPHTSQPKPLGSPQEMALVSLMDWGDSIGGLSTCQSSPHALSVTPRTLSTSRLPPRGATPSSDVLLPTPPTFISPHDVLMHGGGVIFTDEFLQQHPNSSIASLTREFTASSMQTSMCGGSVSLHSTEERARDAALSTTSTSSSPRMRNYLHEVFCYQRPVFRRVESLRRYGRGWYWSQDDVPPAADATQSPAVNADPPS